MLDASELLLETGTIETLRAHIAYKIFYTQKSKNKLPLVCLHGGPGVSHNYLLALKNIGYQRPIVFYDQSGCGNSTMKDPNFTEWTLEYYTQELVFIIENLSKKLGCKKINLLGHSWGAMLATNYVARNQEKIEKLVFSGPCISAPDWIADCKKLAQDLDKNMAQIIEEHEATGITDDPEYTNAVDIFYKNFFCRKSPLPELPAENTGTMNRAIYVSMWGPYEMTATGNLKDVDLSNLLPKIEISTLLMCGEYDMATPERIRSYAKTMQNAQVVVHKDTAHCTPKEDPELYYQVVKEFLEVL